jgi:hypothetical protein
MHVSRQPVLFLHFHKCAGSFVTKFAQQARYRMAYHKDPHTNAISCLNGNIMFHYDTVETIRLFSEEQVECPPFVCRSTAGRDWFNWDLQSFSEPENMHIISYLLNIARLEYIAFESVFPSASLLNKLSYCTRLALVRDPVKRLISDYIYASCYGLSPADGCSSVVDYARKGEGFAQPNIYTKLVLFQSIADTEALQVTPEQGIIAAEKLMRMTTHIYDPDRINLEDKLADIFVPLDGVATRHHLEKENTAAQHISNNPRLDSSSHAINYSEKSRDEVALLNDADIAFYDHLISNGAI